MPHYKDGSEAKVGDIVKGTGYNVKGSDGKPKVIVGQLVQITPSSESCNCIVSFLDVRKSTVDLDPLIDAKLIRHSDYQRTAKNGIADGGSGHDDLLMVPSYDYGQCDQFELVHRPE